MADTYLPGSERTQTDKEKPIKGLWAYQLMAMVLSMPMSLRPIYIGKLMPLLPLKYQVAFSKFLGTGRAHWARSYMTYAEPPRKSWVHTIPDKIKGLLWIPRKFMHYLVNDKGTEASIAWMRRPGMDAAQGLAYIQQLVPTREASERAYGEAKRQYNNVYLRLEDIGKQITGAEKILQQLKAREQVDANGEQKVSSDLEVLQETKATEETKKVTYYRAWCQHQAINAIHQLGQDSVNTKIDQMAANMGRRHYMRPKYTVTRLARIFVGLIMTPVMLALFSALVLPVSLVAGVLWTLGLALIATYDLCAWLGSTVSGLMSKSKGVTETTEYWRDCTAWLSVGNKVLSLIKKAFVAMVGTFANRLFDRGRIRDARQHITADLVEAFRNLGSKPVDLDCSAVMQAVNTQHLKASNIDAILRAATEKAFNEWSQVQVDEESKMEGAPVTLNEEIVQPAIAKLLGAVKRALYEQSQGFAACSGAQHSAFYARMAEVEAQNEAPRGSGESGGAGQSLEMPQLGNNMV